MADEPQQSKKTDIISPYHVGRVPSARRPTPTQEELAAGDPPLPIPSLPESDPHRLTGREAVLLAVASGLSSLMVAPVAAATPPPAQSVVIDTPTAEHHAWPLGVDTRDVAQLLAQLEQTAKTQPEAPKVTWKDGTLTITLGIGSAAVAGLVWRLTKLVEACIPALVQVFKNQGEREITIESDGTKVTIRGTNDPEAALKIVDQLSKPHIMTS